MAVIGRALRSELNRARVAHFASSTGKRPSLVPVCFVLIGDTAYHALDAKPKAVGARQLARVKNVRANPNAALLIDHYQENWNRLWYAMIHGRARVIERGAEHRRAIVALKRKYPQYRRTAPLSADALVIALDAGRLSHWRASSSGHRGRRRGSPA